MARALSGAMWKITVESIDDSERSIGVLAQQLPAGALARQHAGDLVLRQQGSVQLASLDHPAVEQIRGSWV